MASIARIPFSQSDEAMINSMSGWMLFLAIVHFLGGAFFLTCGCFGGIGAGASFAVSPVGAALLTLQMLSFLVLGVLLTVEGVMLVQARGALGAVVTSDQNDQELLSRAFNKLKLFFMLELLWFAINIFVGLLGLALAIVAPEMGGGGFGNFNQGGFGQPGGFGGGGGNW